MTWKLTLTLLAGAAIGCTSDDFRYGTASTGGSPPCDGDGCPEACPPGQQRAQGGVCEPICVPWQTAMPMPSPGAIAVVGSVVYAAGTSAEDDGRPPQGLVQRALACGGQLDDAVLPLSDKGSSLRGAAATADTLIVAGASEGKITLAELDAASGATKLTHVVSALPADAVVNDLAAGPGGAWAVGTSKTAGAWFAHLSAGKVCSGALPGTGNASAVAASKEAALIALEIAGKLRFARVEAGGCAAPSFTSPDLALPGADSASARDLLVIDATAYLVGHARVGAGEPFGFVASVDVSSGALGSFVRWDPGAGTDAFHAVAAIGTSLFAGGVAGAALPDDDASGSAMLIRWKLPLENDAAPLGSETLGARRVQALAVADSAVFALAATGTGVSTIASFAAE